MNFPPFGGHFSTTLPTIHQFAAKFSQDTTPASSSTAPSLCSTQEATNNSRYTANGVPSFTQHHHVTQPQVLTALNTAKCQSGYVNHGLYAQQRPDKRPGAYEPQELAQELCAVMLQQNHHHHQQQEKQQEKGKPEIQIPERRPHQSSQQPLLPNQLPPPVGDSQNAVPATTSTTPWQSLTNTNSTVVDYLSQLPTSTLPLSLHHFLKYSAENLKKENAPHMQNVDAAGLNLLHNGGLNVASNVSLANNVTHNGINNLTSLTTINAAQLQGNNLVKKKKKKKPEKEKKPKPKPGEIRLTTALDGSTLYCCPECHMAYPEKELLEQHLLGHTMERRFVCDICGAGLKRKDHLTRHKQSHNPERPYVCSVCLKAFKRKEQLTLHFVIHSGEKRHVCTECGKGFYRKDHLRKHTRSHIARRVKAELSQQDTANAPW